MKNIMFFLSIFTSSNLEINCNYQLTHILIIFFSNYAGNTHLHFPLFQVWANTIRKSADAIEKWKKVDTPGWPFVTQLRQTATSPKKSSLPSLRLLGSDRKLFRSTGEITCKHAGAIFAPTVWGERQILK